MRRKVGLEEVAGDRIDQARHSEAQRTDGGATGPQAEVGGEVEAVEVGEMRRAAGLARCASSTASGPSSAAAITASAL